MNENQFNQISGKLKQTVSQIAARHGVETVEMEHELRIAMLYMMFNPDPIVKKQWESIPHESKLPSPEEFIAWAVERVLSQI